MLLLEAESGLDDNVAEMEREAKSSQMTRKSIVQLLDNTQVHCATLDTPHNIKLAIMIYDLSKNISMVVFVNI